MTPEQIVALVLALTGPAPDKPLFPVLAAGGADRAYPVVMRPCPRPLAPLEVEGRTVACGAVSVPEDHARPGGRRIELTFMIFKSRSLAPAPDAVVHLHGGPGVGIVERVSMTSTYFEQLRTRRDVVAFDQRGVDASASAQSRCFATLAADSDTLIKAARSGGLSPAATGKVTRDCLDEIAASGADISQINTAQNARDVRAVMRALGYPVYNIYGISYGTKLSQEVMRTAPEGLRSVILDSVAPVQAPVYEQLALPYAESIQYVFDLCSADAKCAAAYPNLRARFWALSAKLETAPIQTPDGPVGSDVLLDVFDRRNSWRNQLQGATAYVPKMIAELEAGNVMTLRALQANALGLHPTPESALAGLKGLDADSLAFARTALRQAQIDTLQQATLVDVLTRLEADRQAQLLDSAPVDAFDAALGNAARALPDAKQRAAFGADYLRLRTVTPAAAPVAALIRAHIPQPQAGRLTAQLSVLTQPQIDQFFARIGADNRALDSVLLTGFQTQMFACQEDVDINTEAGTEAFHAQLRAKYGWTKGQTDAVAAALQQSFFGPCKQFTPHPRPGFHDPVTAAIPTLVLQGTMDVQTAPSWGALMVSSLPKGQLVMIEEAGHGTLSFSQCARDLGTAFIEDPLARLDTSCAKPVPLAFVLPDGSRSR
jgi:pimeloyl-ACP methyl ester carboxylesterase